MLNEKQLKEKVRKFLKKEFNLSYFELCKTFNFDSNGRNAVYELSSYQVFISHLAINEDEDVAIDLLKKEIPDRDWNNFEIQKVDDLYIVFD